MAGDWYYARKGERFGPVPWAKVRALAEQGWLMPGDLVWNADMPDWQPAASVRGLFKNSLVESLGAAVDGVIPASRSARGEPVARPASEREPVPPPDADFFARLSPRHVVSACGAFVAALGVAFTVIEPSSLGFAFTLGGLVLLAAGLSAELAAWVSGLLPAAEPRVVAVEQDGLGEQVMVVNHPPVKRWSPLVAAVLSFLVPGLGQFYKGQALGGIVWFFLVGAGYLALILPGMLLHVFCIAAAATRPHGSPLRGISSTTDGLGSGLERHASAPIAGACAAKPRR